MNYLHLFLIVIAAVSKPILVSAEEKASMGVDQRLVELETEFLASYDALVALPFAVKVTDLNGKYVTALDRALEVATQAGKLDEAIVLRDEKKFVADEKCIPQADAANEPAILKQMRNTYRSELKKLEVNRDLLEAPLLAKHDAVLEAYQTLLTTEKKLDEALKVREARQRVILKDRPKSSNPTTTLASQEEPPVAASELKFAPVPKVVLGEWITLYENGTLFGCDTKHASFQPELISLKDGALALNSTSIPFDIKGRDIAIRATAKKLGGQNLSLRCRVNGDEKYSFWFNGGTKFGCGAGKDGKYKDLTSAQSISQHIDFFELDLTVTGRSIKGTAAGETLLDFENGDVSGSGHVEVSSTRGISLFKKIQVKVIK